FIFFYLCRSICSFLIVYFPFFFIVIRLPLRFTLFPYTTLFRSKSTFNGFKEILFKIFKSSCLASASKVIVTISPSALKFSIPARSEEHTSELQSRFDLVCRLLLEKKNCETSCSCHWSLIRCGSS